MFSYHGRAQDTTGTPPVSATLTILSTPDGASVFLDSVRVGTTPLTIDAGAPRTVTMMVVRSNFESETRTVTIDSGRSATFSFTLRPWVTTGSFVSNSPSTVFRLRPKPRTVHPGDTAVIAFGGVEVTAEDTLTGVKTTRFFLVNARAPMTFRSEMNFFAPWKVLRGIAVPGLVSSGH